MKRVLVHSISILVVILALLAVPAPQAVLAATGPRCYVNASAPGPTHDGDSWVTAYIHLYEAMDLSACTEIWVAAGFYTPDPAGGQTWPLQLLPDTQVYGGFAGGETSLSERDWKNHVTILSGDVDLNDINTDGNHIDENVSDIQGSNSWHVVTIDGSDPGPVTASTVLDGFTITGGTYGGGIGGGLFCYGGGAGHNCSATLSNLTFIGNQTGSPMGGKGGGLGIFADDSGTASPTIHNVLFKNNYADLGGALAVEAGNGTSSPTLTDVSFENNSAATSGGAAYVHAATGGTASPTFNRATFSANAAGASAGALYSDAASGTAIPVLANATFYGNTTANFAGAVFNRVGAGGSSYPGLVNVTFSGNSAPNSGGALVNDVAGPGATLSAQIYNAIFWGDSAPIAQEVNNGGGAVSHVGYSVVSGGCGSISGADCTPGGNLSTDPLLGPLADNGGAVETMALLSGSSAIEAGYSIACLLAPVGGLDAREVARPQGSACDVGAFEYDQVFSDVPVPGKEWMERWVDAFYSNGITTGCGVGPLRYCPENNVTRAEMAVFLLRAKHGSGYAPPAASHFFTDVPVTGKEWMEPWIDEYYREGLTTGCGVSPLRFCPENQTTRAEMAVFILRAMHSSGWAPPAATGVFSDVPVLGKEWMQPWIEEYYHAGITTGCGVSPLRYCPENNTTRAEMAVFLDRAYALYP